MDIECEQNLSVLIIHAGGSKLRLWLKSELIIRDRCRFLKFM